MPLLQRDEIDVRYKLDSWWLAIGPQAIPIARRMAGEPRMRATMAPWKREGRICPGGDGFR